LGLNNLPKKNMKKEKIKLMVELEKAIKMANEEIKEWNKFKDIALRKLSKLN